MKLVLLLFLISCSSQKPFKSPYYWETEFQGKTYRFFGTMHAGFGIENVPADIKQDLLASHLLAVEATPELAWEYQHEKKERLKDSGMKGLLPYPALSRELSPEAWKHLEYTLRQQEVQDFILGLGIRHSYKELHPIVILMLTDHFIKKRFYYLFHPDILKRYSDYHDQGIRDEVISVLDLEIMELAKKNGIRTVALDTVKLLHASVGSLQHTPGLPEVSRFYSGYDSKEEHKKLRALQEDYLSGDEQRLIQTIAEAEEFKGEEVQERLFINRNKHWFDELIQKDEQTIFVAVGVGHLIGENSLISFFRDRGAQVIRK